MHRAETQMAKRNRMIKSAAKKVDVAMIMGVWMEVGEAVPGGMVVAEVEGVVWAVVTGGVPAEKG